MNIAGNHDVSALMAHKDALHIMDVLAESGFETRFVGGCVRDVLLHRDLGDIDLATTGTPDAVMAQLNRHNIHVVPTGIDHGTVMAVINDRGYEITTLRYDITTDGRHATVGFTDDWVQDAHRRDFTINALSVDRQGVLHDYCGGLDDMRSETLRFIDDAALRIAEDYLRMLRLFRFSSVLGWDIIDTDLLELCRLMAPNMEQLSRERIQSELYKLLIGPNCMMTVNLMAEYDLLEPWTDTLHIQKLAEIVTHEELWKKPDAFRRFIALIGYDDLVTIESMVVLSRQQKKRLNDISVCIAQHAHSWSQEKFCYFFGSQATEDCLVLFTPQDWTPEFLENWNKPLFPLKAEHIMSDTGGANAFLGRVLKQTESWWVDQEFKPELALLQAYAKDLIAQEK